jgi:hypothetical protein
VILAAPAGAGADAAVEIALGGAFNLPTRLTVRQDGEVAITHRARWESRSFRFPLYYRIGLAWEAGDTRWSLDLVHHKLHLAHPPPEVGEFAVSHGYNLVTAAWARRVEGVWIGGGAGAVVAHPENTVRGRTLAGGGIGGSGYHLTGPTAALFVRRDVPLGGRWRLPLEARGTFSWARVPVVDGDADVPNVALHATVGVGRALP